MPTNVNDAEREAKDLLLQINSECECDPLYSNKEYCSPCGEREEALPKVIKAIQRAKQIGYDRCTAQVDIGHYAKKYYNEGVLQSAEIVRGWHYKKGGYETLAEAIRKEVKK